jgi:thiamine-monophosphate kinase
LQAHGLLPAGRALRRDGARPGDGIYVTGSLGDGGGGLAVARGLLPGLGEAEQGWLRRRLDYPEPRIAVGIALRGVANAAIDISDGLLADLGHILQRSGVGASVEVDALPLSDALRAAVGAEAALEMALCAGDDYELCFTVPEAGRTELERRAREWECRWTRIGTIEAAAGLRTRRADGSVYAAGSGGYDHFAGG